MGDVSGASLDWSCFVSYRLLFLMGATLFLVLCFSLSNSPHFYQWGQGSGGRIAPLWAAPKTKKKVPRKYCVRYHQRLGADKQSVDIRLHNRCSVVMSCHIRWQLACDEDSGRPRDFDKVVLINRKGNKTIRASARACGDDGWSIEAIRWKCVESLESQ